MLRKLIVFALLVVILPAAHGIPKTVLSPRKLNVATGASTWVNHYMRGHGSEADTTECRETEQIPSAYVCLSLTKKNSNGRLARVMLTDGDSKQRQATMISNEDPQVAQAIDRFAGSSLSSSTLLAFWTGMQAKVKSDGAAFAARGAEKEFFLDFVMPLSQKRRNFYVISIAAKSNTPYGVTLGHEILHAQYDLQPDFKRVVKDFWSSLSDVERARVSAKIAEKYVGADDGLAVAEFQAYMLMPNAAENYLAEFVPQYRARLQAALARQKINIIQCEFDL